MKVIVDNLLINYKTEGKKGGIVVMLHGWGDTLETFNSLTEALAKKYQVIRLDFPGFGGSQRPPTDWHIQDYAQFLTAFLRKLNITTAPVAVIAHSFGGRVTIKSIAEGLLCPQKVVLMGSAGIKPKDTARKTVYKVVAKTGKAATNLPGLSKLQSKLRGKLYQAAGTSDYLQAQEMRQIFLNTINEDLQDDATHLLQPTLLLWGEEDNQTPVSDAKRLHKIIQSSQLVVLPGAGHFVHHEQSAAVEKKIKDFLA